MRTPTTLPGITSAGAVRAALALALLLLAAGPAAAQPKLTLIGFVPPDQTVTNQGSAVIRFDVANNPANRCDVTIFRNDGASTLVAGVQPGTGPFSVTVPLPRGVDNRQVTFSGIVQDTVTGQLAAGNRQLTIVADDTAPQPPTIQAPPFPATVNTNVLTVTGVVLRADGTRETSGTVIITRIDPPNAGSVIGAGAVRLDGAFTATADLTSFTTGVASNIGFRADDGAGNKSTVITRQVTKAQVANPVINNATMDPPPGTVTNNPAVLIRGSVTGTNGPFTVNFLVDGFLESQVFLLNSGDSFTHTLTLASDGVHSIAIRAQNSNTPPNSGALVTLGQLTLDRVAPAAPVIIDPNPVGPTPVVTSGTLRVRGFSGERKPSTTSTAEPVVLASGPPNVSFAPASPLPIDNATGQFDTQVNVANLEDGQHRLTFAVRDAAGNTGPGSSVDVFFIKDTRAPVIDQVRVNGTIAPQTNPEIFVGQGTVDLQLRISEELVNVPKLDVVQAGGSALPAGVSSNTATIFNYVYGAIPGFDGPARIQVSAGRDRAGNVLTAAVDRLFIVDTVAPQVTSVTPKDASTLAVSPAVIRVTFKDPPSSAGTAAGADLFQSRIILEGPLGSGAQTIPGTASAFDPVTLDFVPTQPLKTDGTYRIRVIAVDKVRNRSESFSSTFVFDTTPIVPNDSNVLPNPKDGACVNATTIPGGAAAPTITVRLTDPQVDLARSTMVVRDFCRIPPTVPGTLDVVAPDTLRFRFAQPLATDGRQDGVYNIGVTLQDIAGNVSQEFNRSFRYDTLTPSVAGTYPTSNSAVSGPLRAVDALLSDPRFDNCRERCGIDRTGSTTGLQLLLVIPNPNTNRNRNQPLPFKITGTLRFISVGNLDKVLLELVGPDLASNGLRTDGTDDGVYRLEAVAVDGAGNKSPLTSATFFYDNLTPDLTLDNVRDGIFLTGSDFTLTGNTADDPGGSGVERVTVSLESIDANNSNTTSVPIFRELPATLDPAAPGATNPRRNFTFTGDLRSVTNPTLARLTVKSFDRAGNARIAAFRVNLQTSALRPPELSSPPMRHSTANPIVTFDWLAVPGAADYKVKIVGPNLDERTFGTDGATSLSVNLAPLTMGDGSYFWSVASIDPLGRQGVFSQNRILILDREKPRVVAVDVIDPSPEAVGSINEGEVRFTLKFSEPMDTRFPLVPKIRPQNTRAPLVEVAQTTYDGDTWTGRAVIPEDGPGGIDFNGLAELQILGAKDANGAERPPRDLAGNVPEPAPLALLVFEIDTGPSFRVGLFQNPVDRKDVILLVKGYATEGGPAQRIDESLAVVVRRTGASDQTPQMIRVSESTFRGLFRMDTSSVQPVRLEITGRDRQGNSSTRLITLSVTLLEPGGTAIIASGDGVLRLKASSAHGAEQAFMLVPESAGSVLDETVDNPAPEAATGLISIGRVQQFYPSGLAFSSAAELTADLARLDPPVAPELASRAGIYSLRDGKWRPVASRREGAKLVAAVADTGPFGLFADQAPPSLSLLEPAAGDTLETSRPTVRAALSDAGSGVEPGACSVVIDGVARPAIYDESAAELAWTADRSLAPGQHSLRVEAADRAGNKSATGATFAVPAAIAFDELAAYPNPARTRSDIRYRLNQPADAVIVRVYDSSGARVASLDAPAGAGVQIVTWPLTTTDGEPVASGVYLVRVEASLGGRKAAGKLKVAVLR
ncbi:MAG: T9SS type A sorting domain-containing protein [Candidatus Wallbacteria bacterium]|nr:T9SS type A sorting domain-containing protein [Candidatus Wallbacteria bacterium]